MSIRWALILLLVGDRWAQAQGLAVEARRLDGPPVPGMLTLSEAGFRFQPSKSNALPWDEIDTFRCKGGESPPLRIPILVQVGLIDGQSLTGEVVKSDDSKLFLRTTWAEQVAIPRAAIERLGFPNEMLPVFADSFEKESNTWKLVGKVERREGDSVSGKRSLVLDNIGQSAAMVFSDELTTGRFGVSFRVPTVHAGRRWYLELEFASKPNATTIRINIAGRGDTFEVQSPQKPEYRGQVRRVPGWQRLCAEFTPKSLRIFVDDRVLWSQAEGPGGSLRGCRFVCETTLAAQGEGEVRIDEVTIHRAVKPRRDAMPTDATQDAVMSRQGDVLFGTLTRIDWSDLELAGSFGKRAFSWTEVSEARFRRLPLPSADSDGEHVRLAVRSGDGTRDRIEGVVKKLNANAIVLGHVFCGELTIPVSVVDELKPLFFGKAFTIDNGPHHLGKQTRSRFLMPKPEGMTLVRHVKLDAVEDGAVLVVEVCQVCGRNDSKSVADSLRRGGMQTIVSINDQKLGCLNDLVDRTSSQPSKLRLKVPRQLLAIGDNALEFRQTVDSETGQSADCELRSIHLEIPRPR